MPKPRGLAYRRRNCKKPEIGRDRKFLYDRFAMKLPFSTDDLSDIAKALNVTPETIIFVRLVSTLTRAGRRKRHDGHSQ